ncbi:MAG: hypothetical protein AAGB00_06530 [Planctomycetota bacterium]
MPERASGGHPGLPVAAVIAAALTAYLVGAGGERPAVNVVYAVTIAAGEPPLDRTAILHAADEPLATIGIDRSAGPRGATRIELSYLGDNRAAAGALHNAAARVAAAHRRMALTEAERDEQLYALATQIADLDAADRDAADREAPAEAVAPSTGVATRRASLMARQERLRAPAVLLPPTPPTLERVAGMRRGSRRWLRWAAPGVMVGLLAVGSLCLLAPPRRRTISGPVEATRLLSLPAVSVAVRRRAA